MPLKWPNITAFFLSKYYTHLQTELSYCDTKHQAATVTNRSHFLPQSQLWGKIHFLHLIIFYPRLSSPQLKPQSQTAVGHVRHVRQKTAQTCGNPVDDVIRLGRGLCWHTLALFSVPRATPTPHTSWFNKVMSEECLQSRMEQTASFIRAKTRRHGIAGKSKE